MICILIKTPVNAYQNYFYLIRSFLLASYHSPALTRATGYSSRSTASKKNKWLFYIYDRDSLWSGWSKKNEIDGKLESGLMEGNGKKGSRRSLQSKVVKRLNRKEERWVFTSRQTKHTAWGKANLPGSGRVTRRAVIREISALWEGKRTRTSPASHLCAVPLLNTTEDTTHHTVPRPFTFFVGNCGAVFNKAVHPAFYCHFTQMYGRFIPAWFFGGTRNIY